MLDEGVHVRVKISADRYVSVVRFTVKNQRLVKKEHLSEEGEWLICSELESYIRLKNVVFQGTETGF